MCASDKYLPLCESHVMLMLDFEGSVLGDHLTNASNVKCFVKRQIPHCHPNPLPRFLPIISITQQHQHHAQ